MTTTILLLSVDEAPMLEHSLPAAQAQGPDTEVVVIDNACTDATAELARRHGARHLRLEHRHTYAAAINVALAQTRGDAVLLLNADCFLDPGFVEAAAHRLQDQRVGSVAPKLLRVSGPRADAGLNQIDAAGMFVDRRRKNGLVGHGAPVAAFGVPGEAFGADGAAALYRRRTLEDCALEGGEILDEDLELWASDADLAWRAQLLGWRCAYEPSAQARHIRTYSPSTRAQMSEQARRLQFRNRLLMMVKNETPAGLARHGPWIAGYEALALGHALLRERHLLRGYREAWKLLPAARRRRRSIQERRRTSLPPFGITPPAS
jgi:GT2 family glycosyltransferase